MWEDEDFEVCQMDDYCSELNQDLKRKLREGDTRIFRAWRETWETVPPGPTGNNYLQARMVRKYRGLKWLDPDSEYSPTKDCTSKDDVLRKEEGGKRVPYSCFCMDDYDFDKSPSEQEAKYDVWELKDDLYELIVDYYSNNTDDEMKVKCYTEDADCDSEEGEE